MNNNLLIIFGFLLIFQILVQTYINNKARYQTLPNYFISSYFYAGLTFFIRAISFIMLVDAYVMRRYSDMIRIGVVYASCVALGSLFIIWIQKREQKKHEITMGMQNKANKILKARANKSAPKNFKRANQMRKK